jgi:hypothetical protein
MLSWITIPLCYPGLQFLYVILFTISLCYPELQFLYVILDCNSFRFLDYNSFMFSWITIYVFLDYNSFMLSWIAIPLRYTGLQFLYVILDYNSFILSRIAIPLLSWILVYPLFLIFLHIRFTLLNDETL